MPEQMEEEEIMSVTIDDVAETAGHKTYTLTTSPCSPYRIADKGTVTRTTGGSFVECNIRDTETGRLAHMRTRKCKQLLSAR